MELERGRRWQMKWCMMLFICSAVAATSFAQEKPADAAPPIEVLKLKWEKEVRLPRNFDPSVIPANGAFNDPTSRTSATAPTSAIDATRVATARVAAASSSSSEFPATPGRLPVFYVYSIKVRNAGASTIEGIAWDYLFIDPSSNTELGSHHFLSYEKVSPNKIVTLNGQLRSPPTRVVQASNSRRNQRPRFVERAVIQCVLYSDGAVWQSQQARDGVCDLLKSSKTGLKRKHGAAESR